MEVGELLDDGRLLHLVLIILQARLPVTTAYHLSRFPLLRLAIRIRLSLYPIADE